MGFTTTLSVCQVLFYQNLINAINFNSCSSTYTGFFATNTNSVLTLRVGTTSYLSTGYYSTGDNAPTTNVTTHVIMSNSGNTSLDRSTGQVVLRRNKELCIGDSRQSSGSTPNVRRIVSILPVNDFTRLRFAASAGEVGGGTTIKIYGVN